MRVGNIFACSGAHVVAVMTFLPATLLLWRRSPPLLSSSVHLCQRRLNSSHSVASHVSFDELGLNRSVVAALQEAFPNVQHPTNIQRQFIPALLQGRDILLKDRTGSGKFVPLLSVEAQLLTRYVSGRLGCSSLCSAYLVSTRGSTSRGNMLKSRPHLRWL